LSARTPHGKPDFRAIARRGEESMRPIVLLFAIAGCCALVAPVEARESVYTSLKEPHCKTANRNPAAKRDEHEPVLYRCPGVKGWTVHVTYHGTFVTAIFAPDGKPLTKAQLGAPYDIGPRVEWRGEKRAGVFVADAAVVRLTALGDKRQQRSVLAALRIDGDAVCAVAVVDAAANKDANALARKAADEAASFKCGADAPRVIGVETETTKEALERIAETVKQ
jgi:hypothetical protein